MRRSLCDVESRLKMTPPLSVARAALLCLLAVVPVAAQTPVPAPPAPAATCARCGCARGQARDRIRCPVRSSLHDPHER